MNQPDRAKTFLMSKLKVHVSNSFLNQIKIYSYQNHQHQKIYKFMYIKQQNMMIEFSLTWTCSDWIRVLQLSNFPDLLPQPCYEALCTKQQLKILKSSSISELHLHVRALGSARFWTELAKVMVDSCSKLHQDHESTKKLGVCVKNFEIRWERKLRGKWKF